MIKKIDIIILLYIQIFFNLKNKYTYILYKRGLRESISQFVVTSSLYSYSLVRINFVYSVKVKDTSWIRVERNL